ncbi:MAG: replication-associated recombination protein A [Acutalibacteraceae bacterium]|jgi:putative ATPase|nr:replication-associated recombination protein A [Clostridiales bacterium]
MSAPLADRLRPQKIEEIVGQEHLLGEGRALGNIVASKNLPNLVFYGPSGVGKTTLASIIAKSTNRTLRKLNGTNASTADIKEIVAELDTLSAPNGILLYLDEIQYFNKKQQQSLLEYIEKGDITLIASTAENPYFYVYSAILSRSTVFEFKPVLPKDIEKAVLRGFEFLRNETDEKIELENGVSMHIATACGGDVRKAINAVELCFLSTLPENNVRKITLATAKELTQSSSMKYDRQGDEHYDLLSAFQKSMRGSDADAALHYLARLLEAGDLLSAARRLLVCACEDVGLAYPMIIPIVKSAVDIAFQVGLPEAKIPLADAVVLVCNSPKSNSAYLGIKKATNDVKKGLVGAVPRHLQNMHYDGADNENKGQFYNYPHEYDNHWINQQYLPDVLKNAKYYEFGDNKTEQAAKEYWRRVKGND